MPGANSLELGDPVQVLGPGIRHAGQHRADRLALPSGYGAGQGEQLGNVVVLRRSVRFGFPPPGSRGKVAERETHDG